NNNAVLPIATPTKHKNRRKRKRGFRPAHNSFFVSARPCGYVRNMRAGLFIAVPIAAAILAGCAAPGGRSVVNRRNDFVGCTDFAEYAISPGAVPGELVLTSPEIAAHNSWDELIVSW